MDSYEIMKPGEHTPRFIWRWGWLFMQSYPPTHHLSHHHSQEVLLWQRDIDRCDSTLIAASASELGLVICQVWAKLCWADDTYKHGRKKEGMFKNT